VGKLFREDFKVGGKAVTAAIEVKERPILFSGPMVRRVLAGKKTQTRRVIKLTEFQPTDTKGYDWCFRDKRSLWNDVRTPRLLELCPYGQVGERLWVRETWALISPDDSDDHSIDDAIVEFRANTDNPLPGDWPIEDKDDPGCGRWRPSIHMPRKFSRILLEVTDVRVERVQSISEDDVLAEGIVKATKDGNLWKYGLEEWPWCDWYLNPLDAWTHLWVSINGLASWEKNEWVWVVEFKRLQP
jgi:hypothetical protein